jgi:putative addiction module component (TIGR02574 family)
MSKTSVGLELDSNALCAILEPMIDESPLARIVSLNPADRLELIGVVWDSLLAEDLPVTDAEKTLLDIRLADMESNPDDQSPWPRQRS